MTVAQMISQRTEALEKIKMDSNEAITGKGGTAAADLSGLPAAIAAIPVGVELPELTAPASAGQVISGKEYIDADGNKQTGTLVVMDTVAEVETLGNPGVGVEVELESSADGSAMTLTLPEPNLLAENIKSGVSIFGVAGSAKTLRVETGTITPAEDSASITIPCTDGAKAVCVEAAADVISAVEGQSEKKYVTSVAANFAGVDGAANAAMQVWYLTRYASGALTLQNTDGVALSVSYHFYAGTYRWTAYYWEDDA